MGSTPTLSAAPPPDHLLVLGNPVVGLIWEAEERQVAVMFGIFAAISFGIGFILNGTGGDHSVWFSPMGWLLLGLFFLAVHAIGAEGWIRRP